MRVAASLGLAALAACPERTAVWIEQGSTATHLVFLVADTRGGHGRIALNDLRVAKCDDDPPRHHEYQWRLTPGCYVVHISGTGWTQFDVSADGTVTERFPASTASQ